MNKPWPVPLAVCDGSPVRRYPALHAARSEYRGRRAAALGLPVLAVLTWMAAGLLHQPTGPVPLVRHVTNIEGPGRSGPPEEIAQSALRPSEAPASAGGRTPERRSRAIAAAPRLTPAATSRPVPPALPFPVPPTPPRPAASAPAAASSSGTEPDPAKTRRPRAALPSTAAGTPQPPPTDAARLAETAATATSPMSRPSASPGPVPSPGAEEPSPARSDPFAAPAEPRSATPSPAERRTTFDPEPVPQCGGFLLPLLGCPLWAPFPWVP